jgi:hypothetical protein
MVAKPVEYLGFERAVNVIIDRPADRKLRPAIIIKRYEELSHFSGYTIKTMRLFEYPSS